MPSAGTKRVCVWGSRGSNNEPYYAFVSESAILPICNTGQDFERMSPDGDLIAPGYVVWDASDKLCEVEVVGGARAYIPCSLMSDARIGMEIPYKLDVEAAGMWSFGKIYFAPVDAAPMAEDYKNPPSIAEVNKERSSNYGHPLDHFSTTRNMVNVWEYRRNQARSTCAAAGSDLNHQQESAFRHTVYFLLDKITRLAQNPLHEDSWVDIEGYSRAGRIALGLLKEKEENATKN